MDIEVKRSTTYGAVIVSDGGATIESDLFDARECNEFALKLIEAAHDIWRPDGETFEEFINEWLNQ